LRNSSETSDGYDICINDIPSNQDGCEAVADEIRNLGRKSCVAVADVSDRDQVDAMVQTSVKELGPLNTMCVSLVLSPRGEPDWKHVGLTPEPFSFFFF
jgi:NAD(P)-dependent dehydrogenase (short-subunit alcohol dehydrogenase family)